MGSDICINQSTLLERPMPRIEEPVICRLLRTTKIKMNEATITSGRLKAVWIGCERGIDLMAASLVSCVYLLFCPAAPMGDSQSYIVANTKCILWAKRVKKLCADISRNHKLGDVG